MRKSIRGPFRRTLTILLASGAGIIAWCGLDLVGGQAELGGGGTQTGTSDSQVDADRTPDGPLQRDADSTDSALDGGVFQCGNVTVTTCLGCAAGELLCPARGVCVADCKSGCDPARVECIACSLGGVVATAICEEPLAAGNCARPPLAHCTCDAAADCPGRRQGCLAGSCTACGEPGSDSLLCKGPPANKHCDHDGTGNQDDELICH